MRIRCSLMRMISVVVFVVLFIPSVCPAAISGRVTRTDGNPEKGATITYTDESNPDIVFTAVTDDDGRYEIMTETSVQNDENSDITPAGFTLHQNYPNPFNPVTVIPFSLEISGFVRLDLYNMLGQKIRTLISGYYSEGHHSVTWNGLDDNGLSAAAGVYIYRLKQSWFVESRKMLLIDGGSALSSGGISRVLPQGTTADGSEALLSNATNNFAKYTGNTSYRVSIYGDQVFPFEVNGVRADDGDVVDFEISAHKGGYIFTFDLKIDQGVETSINDSKIHIDFPAHAFVEDKEMVVGIKQAFDLAPALIFPALNGAGKIWHIDAQYKDENTETPKAELQKNSFLTIPYDQSKLSGEALEEDIFPAYWNGNSWMKVNGVPDIESKSITVETDRLGLWTVFYGRLIGDITVGQAFDLMEDNAENANFVVLDVRTPGEYESVYLQDAVNIDYKSESFRDEMGKLDKSKKYLVYCLAGTRSSGAVSIMNELGFTEVYNMLGGIRQWLFEGYPVAE